MNFWTGVLLVTASLAVVTVAASSFVLLDHYGVENEGDGSNGTEVDGQVAEPEQSVTNPVHLEPKPGDTGDDDDTRDRPRNDLVVEEEAWFEEVGSEAGLGGIYGNKTSGEGTRVVRAYSVEGVYGIGVYTVDYDRDGEPDVLTIADGNPVLHRNTGGEFERTRQLSDVDVKVKSALFFDHDNDGYDDLYLLSNQRSVFLENQDGDYTRREAGLEIGFKKVWGSNAADYTGNGCLDVFVLQSNDWRDTRAVGYDDREVSLEEDNGNPNRLFAGNCSGFQETTRMAGIREAGWSLASSFVDLTGDGLPDIHVANDFNNDVLYVNQGNGSFERRVLPEFTNRNGMSSEIADVDEDGLPEVLVTNIYYDAEKESVPSHRFGGRTHGNYVLKNEAGGFVDVAEDLGIVNGGWGWAAEFEDYDNDGYLDLLHGDSDSGYNLAVVRLWKGGEGGFSRVAPAEAGFLPAQERGVVSLDYDNDGDLDVLTDNTAGEFKLYDNEKADGDSLQVVLEPVDHTVIGSTVTVEYEGGEVTKILTSEADYKSQSARVLHFGLGNAENVTVVVEWADGGKDVYQDVVANRRVELQRGEPPETLVDFG